MPIIEINDFVHATLQNETAKSVAVQDFKVSAINGTSYEGGVLPCDTNDGWYVEVVRKDLSNLNLPTSVSEITVIDASNNSHELTGKNTTWRNAKGEIFDVNLIMEWRTGHGLSDQMISMLQAVAGQTDSGQ
jgi:hypothetical protein